MKDTTNHTITLPSGRILGYAAYGDNKGKPIFYFHGWPSSRLQAQIIDDVAKKLQVRIISVDRPGYGLSEFQRDRTLLDWPDDIVELANNLGIKKFAMIGVSGGGPYAAVCAYKIPARLTKVGIVGGLVPIYPELLEGMSSSIKLGWAHYGKSPLLRTLSALLHYGNAKYGPSLGLHRFVFGARADKKIFADKAIRERARRNLQEAFRTGYKGAALDLQLYTQDWGFNLKDIRTNVCLFYGEDDKNVPINMGRYYASKIPNAKLTVYPGEGHLISFTHCEEILKTLI